MNEKEINQKLSSIHIIALGYGATNALCYAYNQKLHAEYTCIGDVSSINIPEGIKVIPFKSPKNFFDMDLPGNENIQWCYSEIKIPDNILDLFSSKKNYIILVAPMQRDVLCFI